MGVGSGKRNRSRKRIQRSQSLQSALTKVEKSIINRSTEKVFILDDNGNILLEKAGTDKRVIFTKTEVALMKGRTLTHNHPLNESADLSGLGTGFSQADLRTAIIGDLKEIRAFNKNNSVSFSLEKNSILKTNIKARNAFLDGYDNIKLKTDKKLNDLNIDYRANRFRSYQEYSSAYKKIRVDNVKALSDFLKLNQTKYKYIYEERLL